MYRLTNLKIMLIRQRILNSLNQRLERQNLIRHLIHRILHTGTIILRKGLQRDIPSRSPSSVEFGHVNLHLIQTGKVLPVPVCIDIGAEDAIPRLAKSRILIPNKAPELGIGALEHGKVLDGRVDVNALVLGYVDLDGPGFLTVLVEGVGMGLAVDGHAGPAVADDVGLGGVDVFVCLDEVGSED